MLESDHVNFFTKKDLEKLLSKYSKGFKVEERQPITLGAVGLPWYFQYPVMLLHRLKLIKADVYFRLFAVVEV